MVPMQALAQEAAARSVNENESIIVTAQKYKQTLRDVSISIAVIGERNIAETGKDSLEDFINTVPGLSVSSGGPGLSTLAIRGITTGGVRQDEPQTKETVGLYIDEAPVSVNGYNPDISLFDIARIEVLRGPQGTLYGAGSMGGTIRIITNQPDASGLAGMGESTLSVTQHGGTNYNLRGMINLPLAPNETALRATAYHGDYDGFIDDTATNRRNVNFTRTSGAHIQLGMALDERLDANVSFMIHDLETRAREEQSAPFTRAVQAFDGTGDNLKLYSGTLNYQLDGVSITSATSYMDKRNVNRASIESLLLAAFGYQSPSALVDTTKVRSFTQEIRLASDREGRLSYVLGAYFQHYRRDYAQDGTVPGIDSVVGVPSTFLGTPRADQLFYGTQNIDQKQWAAFSEVSLELLPHVAATIGARAFSFRESYSTYSSGLYNGGIDSSSGKTSETGVTPKFGISYQPERNRLFYAVVSKGYRLGGVNTTVPQNLCQADLNSLGRNGSAKDFGSDHVWNYEIGTKASSADGAWSANASAYYIKWDDMQTTLTLPSCFFSFRTNVGQVRSVGLELELSGRLSDRTDLQASLGLTDSRLTRDVPFTTWEDGDRVPSVSPVQVNLALRQAIDLLDDKDAFVRADYNYVSRARSNFDASAPSNRTYNGYTLVDLSGGLILPDTGVELKLFARNVFGSKGRVAAYAGNLVAPERYITVRPRTIGLTVRASFSNARGSH